MSFKTIVLLVGNVGLRPCLFSRQAFSCCHGLPFQVSALKDRSLHRLTHVLIHCHQQKTISSVVLLFGCLTWYHDLLLSPVELLFMVATGMGNGMENGMGNGTTEIK